MVKIPVNRNLVHLNTSYEIPLTARTDDGKEVTVRAEVGFRACERAPGKIVIDGDLSDWKLDERTPFSMEREFTNWGKAHGGPNDLSAKVYTMWDDENLYFAAVVKDDSYVNEANDIDIWQNDNIAFGLHPWGWKLGSKINTGYYREHLGLCKDGVGADFPRRQSVRRAGQRARLLNCREESERRLHLRMVLPAGEPLPIGVVRRKAFSSLDGRVGQGLDRRGRQGGARQTRQRQLGETQQPGRTEFFLLPC